jgi:hypothetical protein
MNYQDGEPIGSRTIEGNSYKDRSAATIRNKCRLKRWNIFISTIFGWGHAKLRSYRVYVDRSEAPEDILGKRGLDLGSGEKRKDVEEAWVTPKAFLVKITSYIGLELGLRQRPCCRERNSSDGSQYGAYPFGA